MRIWLGLSLFFFSSIASANFQDEILKGKKVRGNIQQWTLADWLMQKNQMRLADQWLKANTLNENWLDITASGGVRQYRLSSDDGSAITTSHQNAQAYDLEVYLWFFNLIGEYEATNNSHQVFTGMAGLRLLGDNTQTTSLVVRYGVNRIHDLNTKERWQNELIDAELVLYVFSAIGLEGEYRYFFPKRSTHGNPMLGHRASGGVFADFWAFRIYADYFSEHLDHAIGAGYRKEQRNGFEGGLRILF